QTQAAGIALPTTPPTTTPTTTPTAMTLVATAAASYPRHVCSSIQRTSSYSSVRPSPGALPSGPGRTISELSDLSGYTGTAPAPGATAAGAPAPGTGTITLSRTATGPLLAVTASAAASV
ncbi:hypothetical protein Vretifemale_189, partial [Volvox reticuliferus]